MTPTRTWLLLLAVALAAVPAVRAGDPPSSKPCCCRDDKPATTSTCPAEAKSAAKCCDGDCCDEGCCADGQCSCDAKSGCECKDCCCAKGCSCGKGAAKVKAGTSCPVSGCCSAPCCSAPCTLPMPTLVRPAMPAPAPTVYRLAPPAMPQPLPIAQTMPLPAPPIICVPPMPATAPAMPTRYREVPKPVTKWCVQVAKEDGQSCLQICDGDDCKVCCEKFVLTIAEQSIKVAARDGQVCLDGPFLKGSADRVMRSKHKDQVILEGHVKLQYSKDGQKADLSGGTVVVDLDDGSVHMKPAQDNQVFQFFLGFFE